MIAAEQAKIICLMGPTASGKTALAEQLCAKLPCDIVSVDSAMIYRGMDIGTATPTPDEQRRMPHRLIDIVDPSESYSVGQFYVDATQAIEEILAANRIPLLVGGTMMYFHALQQGLSNLPEVNENVRAKLQTELENEGVNVLHERLVMVDVDSAARIHPNDPQRILRALEVYLSTGETLTAWCAEHTRKPLPYVCLNVGLVPEDRAVLHAKIAQRFDEMLANGFEAEVRSLYQRGDLSPDMPSMRCVGYRQMWQYIQGDLSYEQMREKVIVATRQFAKRQLTWLRSWNDLKTCHNATSALRYLLEILP